MVFKLNLNSKMSKEVEDIYCSNCNKKCDQSLMLSCDHNLCMNCAAENLIKNESQGINKIQYIICDLCQKKTEIDTNTSKEVLSFGFINSNKKIKNNFINKNNSNKKNLLIDTMHNKYSFNSIPKKNKRFKTSNNSINSKNKSKNKIEKIENNLTSPMNIQYYNTNFNPICNTNNINTFSKYDVIEFKDNIINNKTICNDHGEPITYICLDCMSQCICVECIIHGIHRNHEVLNIKKAYPLIYEKTKEISNHINSTINELNSTQKNIERKAGEINALNARCKIDIKRAFDELRNLLNKKENEIIERTEYNLNNNLNELNTYNQIIKNKITLLNKLNETVNAYLMRKDELNLINFYSENKNKILAQTELNEINNINDLNINSFSNLKIEIDKSSFDAMISSINSLNYEINTLKGFDIRNRYNLGKFTAKRNLYGSGGILNLENNFNITNEYKNQKGKKKKTKKV